MKRSRLIVWGAGELGGRVATAWARQAKAIGLTQTETRHADLRAQGITPSTESAAAWLQPADTLLLSIPGHQRQRTALEEIIAQPAPARAVLISSTGYYGATVGPIDEQTPAGTSDRAQAIAATEQLFLQWAGDGGVVIRFGGLYRSGRGPFSAFARKKTVPERPPERKLALIHYEDAATATFNALQHDQPQAVYLGVVTPCPTRREFYTAACEKLNLPLPDFPPVDSTFEMVYDTGRLQKDLLPQPAYPDWRAALD